MVNYGQTIAFILQQLKQCTRGEAHTRIENAPIGLPGLQDAMLSLDDDYGTTAMIIDHYMAQISNLPEVHTPQDLRVFRNQLQDATQNLIKVGHAVSSLVPIAAKKLSPQFYTSIKKDQEMEELTQMDMDTFLAAVTTELKCHPAESTLTTTSHQKGLCVACHSQQRPSRREEIGIQEALHILQ